MPLINPPTLDGGFVKNLPEERYNNTEFSHITKLITAIAGSSGVGMERRNNLVGQLQASLATVRHGDIDKLYGSSLGFPRRKSEVYSYDYTDLLPYTEQDEIIIKDSMYRSRINRFLGGIELGCTLDGIKEIASSIVGSECHVVDNVAMGTVTILFNQSGAEYEESTLLLSRILTRFIPRNVKLYIGEMLDGSDISGFLPTSSVVLPTSVSVSSRAYRTVQYVTGRMDSANTSIDSWVEHGVRKVAPSVVGSMETTSRVNTTQLIQSVIASSKHSGAYGEIQKKYMPLLMSEAESNPLDAVCMNPHVSYMSSFYSTGEYVDGMYPTSHIAPRSSSKGVWSSIEDSGQFETIDFIFETDTGVPINEIAFSVSRKPMSISFSYLSDDGTWNEFSTPSGGQTKYTVGAFGLGTTSVSIVTANTLAKAVRLTIERLDTTKQYSVEVGQFQTMFNINTESDLDFVSGPVLIDVAGNIVEYDKAIYDGSSAIDGSSGEYWVSKVNANRRGIEYLVLDFGTEISIDGFKIEPIFMGSRFNIYSSGDGVSWNPIAGSFTLDGLDIEIPMTRGRFFKFEFHTLTPVPIDGSVFSVSQLQFPAGVVAGCAAAFGNGAMSYTGRRDITREMATFLSAGNVISRNDTYREQYDVPVIGHGNDTLTEYPDTSSDLSTGKYPIDVKFDNSQEHDYINVHYDVEKGIGFVVGIKNISAYSSDYLSTIYREEVFSVDYSTADTNTWDVDDYGIMRGTGDSEYVSLPIKSFDKFVGVSISANQRPPYTAVGTSSFEEGIDGWTDSGLDASETVLVDTIGFGSRGSVLSADGDGGGTKRGATSDTIALRTGGMARVSTDLFLAETVSHGQWKLSVIDANDSVIASSDIPITPRKWETHSVEFVPQPAGTWLYNEAGTDEYTYRRMVVFTPSTSIVKEGTSVLVKNIDKSILCDTAGLTDFRVTYFNGSKLVSIPYDYTDAGEVWFSIQKDIPAGLIPNGTFDDTTDEYLGLYHIYYGNASEGTSPTYEPADIFIPIEPTSTVDVVSEQLVFDGSGEFNYVERNAIPYSEGHVTIDYTPASDISVAGMQEKRYLIDMVPSGEPYRIEVYFYEMRLYVLLTHRSGFRSGAVYSVELPVSPSGTHTMANGTKYRILVSWDKPGSQEYSGTEARDIRAWCVKDGDASVGGEMVLIENQYDKITYDDVTEPVRY